MSPSLTQVSHSRAISSALALYRDAQERRGDARSAVLRLVLALEQSGQFGVQRVFLAVLRGGFKRIHRRPVIVTEFLDELRRLADIVEIVGVALAFDIAFGNARGGEAFFHLRLDAPRH